MDIRRPEDVLGSSKLVGPLYVPIGRPEDDQIGRSIQITNGPNKDVDIGRPQDLLRTSKLVGPLTSHQILYHAVCGYNSRALN